MYIFKTKAEFSSNKDSTIKKPKIQDLEFSTSQIHNNEIFKKAKKEEKKEHYYKNQE